MIVQLIGDRAMQENAAMASTSRHDAWQAGDAYESYMGRWSRQIAPVFLAWLDAPQDLDWLEVSCGTGALSAAVLARCAPRSRSEEHTSELQSLMRISYAVFCLKKNNNETRPTQQQSR